MTSGSSARPMVPLGWPRSSPAYSWPASRTVRSASLTFSRVIHMTGERYSESPSRSRTASTRWITPDGSAALRTGPLPRRVSRGPSSTLNSSPSRPRNSYPYTGDHVTEHDRKIAKTHDDILEEIAAALDIPPSKFEEARRRYESIGDWLDRDESTLAAYHPAIPPQGSFLP